MGESGAVCLWRKRGSNPLLCPSSLVLPPLQMRFMLLFSRQGKLRLQKWYLATSDKERKKMVRELMQVVLARKPKMCSFLEWRDLKVVYKRWHSVPLFIDVQELLWSCIVGSNGWEITLKSGRVRNQGIYWLVMSNRFLHFPSSSWNCFSNQGWTSVHRVLTWHAQGPGFDHKHNINQVCLYSRQHLGSRGRRHRVGYIVSLRLVQA